jgi:hypothetical protein
MTVKQNRLRPAGLLDLEIIYIFELVLKQTFNLIHVSPGFVTLINAPILILKFLDLIHVTYKLLEIFCKGIFNGHSKSRNVMEARPILLLT